MCPQEIKKRKYDPTANKRSGFAFERVMARELSTWWTGDDSDVFWRSAGSGGMAKGRGRKGKAAFGQHGDIMATNPIGAPLIKAFTIEIKKGYERYSPFDAIDRHTKYRGSVFENWTDQVTEAATHAGSYAWLILFKRTGRRACIAMPSFALWELATKKTFPHRAEFRFGGLNVACVVLEDFFARVTPASVIRLSEL